MNTGTIDAISSQNVRFLTINESASRNAIRAALCDDLRRALQIFRASDNRLAILKSAKRIALKEMLAGEPTSAQCAYEAGRQNRIVDADGPIEPVNFFN